MRTEEATIPVELYEKFDAAAWKEGGIGWDGYRDYVRELITYTDMAGKQYLKAFMG